MRWRKIGVWDRIFEAISRAYDGDLQMLDSSSIRVHQHAAGDIAAAACMGRSPGGLTTKIHAVVDANGNPVTLKPSKGRRKMRQ